MRCEEVLTLCAFCDQSRVEKEAKSASGLPRSHGKCLKLHENGTEGVSLMGLVILIILILLLIGAVPSWPYSRNWGYWPSGGIGLIVLILLILLLLGRI